MKDIYESIYCDFGGRSTGGHGPDTWEETLELYDVINTVGLPCHVLEIGFNNGGSALAFLLAGASVTSVDVVRNDASITTLEQRFPTQFKFHHIQHRSNEIPPDRFHLAFIDGNHNAEPVEHDIIDCLQLKIPYLLFHDTLHGAHANIRDSINTRVNTGEFTIIREYTVGTGKTLVTVNYTT
jgi:hypothetical protein